MWSLFFVVSAVERVGGCEDGGSGVESGDDTCLSDGDSLLLHNLMDSCSVTRIHFIKLINTADTFIG